MFENYDDVVNVEDLMEMLNIGRNKAYELLQSGKVRSFKVGKLYRIPKVCIQQYVLSKVNMKMEEYTGNSY
ncbi:MULTISPECIES: helix-turn-helix domain-containing protein [Bacillus]|uniref:DNA-binding protein n=1 Tax=Bacillus toyonensis TaxID=155322 RepID=A0AAP8F191_9BACI|nr:MULTISPECIES: helix-turn-helix domain-containing protein [Bacillus]MBK5359503.1 helix-turn-helix domain-containing protein [Bacillus sp. TH44]MBK5347001.1 helix-turn-helix domain-containing protein [Bacillus sp. TH45]MBK5366098.1 helix-turn-helix domain-containing protein [Bacillus sp. TH50]PEB89244.1 DNA-binding protein [Bacillus toyonensis]PHE09236.1 DNA-binding protein [Bacillus toyonensis]